MRKFIALFVVTLTILSCKKSADYTCTSPTINNLQGEWKQDYKLDPLSFSPKPEWERIIIRNDSFFMKIVIRPEQYDSINCFMSKWNEYIKGIISVENFRITFDGIFTDSLYRIKNGGCHSSGPYKSRIGIDFCDQLFTLNILNNDTFVKGDQFKITMLKLK
jgi:hypothetical protein